MVPQIAEEAALIPTRGRSRLEWLVRVWANPKAKIGLILLALFAFMAIAAPILAPGNPSAMTYPPLSGPAPGIPLGTNQLGQSLYAQWIWGSRYSLLVGVISGLLVTVSAVIVGIGSGYVGGFIGELVQLATNIVLVIPFFPLMVVLTAYVPVRGPGVIVAVIVLTGWPWGARVLRAQTLSVRENDYVAAARGIGESGIRIILTEILPNMTSLVSSILLFSSLGAVLAQAGLAFLGLGSVTSISWGTILYWAQSSSAITMGAWWWFLPPGLSIAFLGAAFALLNYAVDEVTNPRLRAQ